MKALHRTRPYKILTVDVDRDAINSQVRRDGLGLHVSQSWQVHSEPNVEILTAPSASLRVQKRLKVKEEGMLDS
eukprot:767726-Hanusia_phi.AAC.4